MNNELKEGVLYCYSRYDKRFSALCAKLECGETIESLYQRAKRVDDASKQGKIAGKGVNPTHLFLASEGGLVPCTPRLRQEFFAMLWYVYLLENPLLVNTIIWSKGLTEKPGDEVYDVLQWRKLLECWDTPQSCNQAMALAILGGWNDWLLDPTPGDTIQPWFFSSPIERSMQRYWKKYHGEELQMIYEM